jgi:hypothetical protein
MFLIHPVGWEATIAYEPNKVRAAVILPEWCHILHVFASRLKARVRAKELVEFETEEEENTVMTWLRLSAILVHGVWSFCYGMYEN